MDTEKYLEQILKGQELDSDQEKALKSAREGVEELLTTAFADCNPTIRYAGSKIKGTMNKVSFDLDIACYFPQDDTSAGETLEDIYNNVKDCLADSYAVDQKTSAIRIKSKESETYGVDFHIDVVPGRFVDDSKKDVFLYQHSGDKKRLKTNLDTHIEHIKNSDHVGTIRLAKLWKEKFGLSAKTFILELLVVKYAKKSDENPLTVGIKTFWEKLRDADVLSVEDPANPDGNDLSTLLEDNTKQLLTDYAIRALESVEKDDWKEIFGETEELTDAEKKKALFSVAASIPNAPRPYTHENKDMVSE